MGQSDFCVGGSALWTSQSQASGQALMAAICGVWREQRQAGSSRTRHKTLRPGVQEWRSGAAVQSREGLAR